MSDDPHMAGVSEWVLNPLTAVFDALDPFAPSAELKGRLEEVAAAWAALKLRMDADPKLARAVKAQYDHWIEFDRKWNSGDRNIDDANAVISDVNVARRTADKTDQVTDTGTIQNVNLDNASAARAAAVKVDETAAKVGIAPGGEWKIPAAILAVGAVIGGTILVVHLDATASIRKRTGTAT